MMYQIYNLTRRALNSQKYNFRFGWQPIQPFQFSSNSDISENLDMLKKAKEQFYVSSDSEAAETASLRFLI